MPNEIPQQLQDNQIPTDHPAPDGVESALDEQGRKGNRASNASLVISVLALLVSSLGFYFQNVRVDEQVFLTASRHRFSEKGLVAFDAVFSNGGNKTVAVTGVTVSVDRHRPGDPETFVIEMPTLVLKPGEVATQPLCVAISDFAKMREEDKPAAIHVNTEIVTSAGRRYRTSIKTVLIGRLGNTEIMHFDGAVVDSIPNYLVVIQQGPVAVIGSDDGKGERTISQGTFESPDSPKETFERAKAAYQKNLLRDVGCSSPSAT